MDLVIGFAIFTGAMVTCIVTGKSMVLALLAGLIIFAAIGCRKGYSFNDVCKMGAGGFKNAVVVIEVMFLIGFVTAVWRTAGTITFFVYYGIRLITPSLFLIITYLLCCVLSYALGTSFGVAGTVGVIFMALARSGGVSEILTAGAVMSGIYFGDRGAPISSSAILVATITHTELYRNIKMMMKTAILPLGITMILYVVLSFTNPIRGVDDKVLESLSTDFQISWWCVIPALCILILPLLKVNVFITMIFSIVTGFLSSVFVQGMPVIYVLKTLISGYKATSGNLGTILDGGGILSMIEVVLIISLSSTYSGIFAGTDMLADIQEKINLLTSKIGRFGAMLIISIGTICVFCNQTIASMMCSDLFTKPYGTAGASNEELAIDIENSVILLSGVVPWALACSVPLSFMGVGIEAIPFSFYLYLVPLCYIFTKKHFYGRRTKAKLAE